MALVNPLRIHPTAAIGPEVELGPDVRVGPFAVLEGVVRVGAGCRIEGYACLSGPLVLGAGNTVGHGAILGKDPQSRAYRGEPTGLRVGAGNSFGERVTVHRGTVDGGGITWIGDGNVLQKGAHLGHDAWIGDGCHLGVFALIGGHVRLGDGCAVAGRSAIQQRVRVGRLARLAGCGGSTRDVPPFMLQQGYNCLTGLNLAGLRRAGVTAEAIAALRQAYRVLYKEGRPRPAALDRIESDLGQVAEVRELVAFVRGSALGINAPRGEERRRWCA